MLVFGLMKVKWIDCFIIYKKNILIINNILIKNVYVYFFFLNVFILGINEWGKLYVLDYIFMVYMMKLKIYFFVNEN